MPHVALRCTWTSQWWRIQEQPPHVVISVIMHHTYFWEEFIDKGGRLCGWVVNISHPISDLVGQSRPCAIVCVEVNESVWVMCKPKRASCCVRESACGTCVGVCVCVCVCGWAAFLSIKVTHGPPSALGEKWTMPNGLGLLLLFSSCHHFLLIHPKWLWVRKTHPATHPHATFATVAPEADTFSEDACKRADSNSAGKNVTDKECLWLMA